MSSILTNNGAMVALQTLKGINSAMAKTQAEISTGKSVSNAKDNAAVWAISKVMESDVSGFKAISDSLSLGQSTVKVAQQAAETVTDLLTQMKGKIVASQESNVDRAKIQTDIAALRDQIGAVVGAAQFNGLNLLSNDRSGTTVANIVGNTGAGAGILGSSRVNVLSSLDRSASGVAISNISVSKSDLGTKQRTLGTGTDLAATALTGATGAINAGATSAAITVVGDTSTAARGGNRVLAGDGYAITGLGFTANYVARDGDTTANIASSLVEQINFQARRNGLNITAAIDSTSSSAFTITNNTSSNITAVGSALSTGGTAGGGLEMLRDFDVSSESGARAALTGIEGLVQRSISAASNFGSVAGRLETQAKFVSALSDSLKSGIGTLVDADMEETSARLQALQVQQQLGVQSLSIANQAPQSILSLFR